MSLLHRKRLLRQRNHRHQMSLRPPKWPPPKPPIKKIPRLLKNITTNINITIIIICGATLLATFVLVVVVPTTFPSSAPSIVMPYSFSTSFNTALNPFLIPLLKLFSLRYGIIYSSWILPVFPSVKVPSRPYPTSILNCLSSYAHSKRTPLFF